MYDPRLPVSSSVLISLSIVGFGGASGRTEFDFK